MRKEITNSMSGDRVSMKNKDVAQREEGDHRRREGSGPRSARSKRINNVHNLLFEPDNVGHLGDLYTESGQTLQGSFSAVSKPIFATKYSLESSRRDLHNALLCTFAPFLESIIRSRGIRLGEKIYENKH